MQAPRCMRVLSMTIRPLILALALAAIALAAPPAFAECKFQKLAEVPVTMDGLRPIVTAKLHGQDAKFMIDTGAFFGFVSDDAAPRYGLKKSIAPFGMTIRGIGGGQADARAVEADSLEFAGARWRNIQFLAGGRVGHGEVVGVIGQNLLGAFDMEYDFANGVLRFFKPDGCEKSNLAYWSSGMALQRISFDNPGRFVQQVKTQARVNGQSIRVTLDSGSPVSFLNRTAAARAGVEPNSPGVVDAGVTYGIYGRGQETYLAPFPSFAIGDEEIKNTRLRVAKIDLTDSDMLLGADFFLSHRILVAKSQSKIYITYNGGPVFRLDRAAASQGVASTDAKLGEAKAGEPKTGETKAVEAKAGEAKAGETKMADAASPSAAELARRAAAAAARREFAQAIDDYTRAIALAPDDAANYHARALARLNARQPVLAMADLDQALKRAPEDVQALMLRGELYLNAKDPVRGRADFEAAMKLAPQNRDLLLNVGAGYTRAGLFEEGVKEFDSWIAAHPKNENLPQVLNARCWTRAAWGKELEAALADCDAALRKDPITTVMQNRALVLLRLGRLDEAIAQYNAALKLQPRAAWSLYGRGLAEQKKGQGAAAGADIQAATAIAPGLPAEARRYGLAAEATAAPAAPTKS
jgi:tetratricopeptide (TPR) repeat protein/predicted aspartyl protease